jgi:iron(III) transport system substrate-binding protein
MAWRTCRAALLLVLFSGAVEARTLITVYTAAEAEHLAVVKQALETELPDIQIRWVRGSTGHLTTRLVSEQSAPVADLILGLSSQSLNLLKNLQALEPFRPRAADQLRPEFLDPTEPYSWTGIAAFAVGACFNTERAAALGLAPPKYWRDLADPALRGRIAMPHPASSGIGLLLIATWIQLMGEEEAWLFMEALHKNVAVYTGSGDAPCVQAARGERVLGVSFDMRALREKSQGAPIELLLPDDGVGWEMSGMALVAGRPAEKTDAARRVIEWASGHSAHVLFARFFGTLARRDVSSPRDYPVSGARPRIPGSAVWAVANRERLLNEWERRFGSSPR